MSLIELLRQCRKSNDYGTLIDNIPYAKTIGMGCSIAGDEVIFRLPPLDTNIGNPTLPAIHGGVLGGFIEQAVVLRVMMVMESNEFPKVIDLAIDYLAAGLLRETFAECSILRMGRRIANVSVVVWQAKKAEPIATARVHLLLT